MPIVNGATSITVSGIAVPLSATSAKVSQVLVQAMPANAGPVFVGDSTTLYSGVSGGGIIVPTPTTGPVVAAPILIKTRAGGNALDLSTIYINCPSGLYGVNFIAETI